MKKLLALTSAALGFLASASKVLALDSSINIAIGTPGKGIFAEPSTVLTNILKVAFILGALFSLFQLVTGAFDWITSEGEKENLDKARKKIINAFVGLAILALSIVIINVIGTILNVNLLNPGAIQSLNAPPGT